jgi:hypothetical protein
VYVFKCDDCDKKSTYNFKKTKLTSEVCIKRRFHVEAFLSISLECFVVSLKWEGNSNIYSSSQE